MRKLAPVEEAKTLFFEAQDWSVWRWLTDKKRVRKVADVANAALDETAAEVKAAWTPAVTAAFRVATGAAKQRNGSGPHDPKLLAAIERYADAEAEAAAAREDAEATFDEAERRLSAEMARQGARKAIESWELKEASIRKAEVIVRMVAGAKT